MPLTPSPSGLAGRTLRRSAPLALAFFALVMQALLASPAEAAEAVQAPRPGTKAPTTATTSLNLPLLRTCNSSFNLVQLMSVTPKSPCLNNPNGAGSAVVNCAASVGGSQGTVTLFAAKACKGSKKVTAPVGTCFEGQEFVCRSVSLYDVGTLAAYLSSTATCAGKLPAKPDFQGFGIINGSCIPTFAYPSQPSSFVGFRMTKTAASMTLFPTDATCGLGGGLGYTRVFSGSTAGFKGCVDSTTPQGQTYLSALHAVLFPGGVGPIHAAQFGLVV